MVGEGDVKKKCAKLRSSRELHNFRGINSAKYLNFMPKKNKKGAKKIANSAKSTTFAPANPKHNHTRLLTYT